MLRNRQFSWDKRPIKFHVFWLVEPHRAHIPHYSHDLDAHAPARDEQRFADRILIAENRLRAGSANQDDVRMIGNVLLVEVAAGEERNSEGPQPAGSNVVRRRPFALRDWRNVAFGA